MKTPEIPNDADGDAMRRVIEHGSDLSRPMEVDFHIAAPNEEAARKIAAAASMQTFETKCSADVEGGKWTCSCSRIMLLVYDDLLRIQKVLDLLSQPFGGYVDGWGTFGNKTEANQAPEPTPTTVTPPAGQEARQP